MDVWQGVPVGDGFRIQGTVVTTRTKFGLMRQKRRHCLPLDSHSMPSQNLVQVGRWDWSNPLMTCTPLPKAAKLVWANQLARLPCLVVNVMFKFGSEIQFLITGKQGPLGGGS